MTGYIQWHATNGTSPNNKTMTADTVAMATRLAKRYMDVTFFGQGSAVITVDGQPKKLITKSAETGYQWQVKTI